MAIKDRILNFIKINENFTPSQISKALNLNPNTVRGRLSELREEFVISKRKITYKKKRTKKEIEIRKKKKKIKKFIKEEEEERFLEDEDEEVEEEIWIRKIVKTTGYSSGRKDTLYALTYENNWINRFNELRDKIIDEFSNSHGTKNLKFGYDDEYVSYGEFEYPEIEVGTE